MTTTDSNNTPDNPGYQAAAKLFVTDLKSNVQMSTAWKTMISQITDALNKATSKQQKSTIFTEAVQACNNFLVQHGYQTTGEDVLNLLKTPFWENHLEADKPNADSDKFVQELLQNAKIFKAWNSLLLQVSSGAKDTDALDDYLKKAGYNCTAIQVNASFVKMRNHQITYWSGTYNTSIQQLDENDNPTSDKPEVGPTLVIAGPNTVQLAADESSKELVRKTGATSISDLSDKTDQGKYVYSNGKLAWEAGPGMFGVSVYSGNITFSDITLPLGKGSYDGKFYKSPPANPYTGPIFSGYISKKDGSFDPFGNKPTKVIKYHIAGELAPDPNNPNHKDSLPAHDPSLREKLAKWLGYCILGFMIIKTVWSMGKKYKNTKDFEKDSDALKEPLDKANTEGPEFEKEIADDASSPYEDMDFADSNILQDLEEEVKQADNDEAKEAAQEKLDEAKQSEDDYDEGPDDDTEVDGDGWANELDDLPFEGIPE